MPEEQTELTPETAIRCFSHGRRIACSKAVFAVARRTGLACVCFGYAVGFSGTPSDCCGCNCNCDFHLPCVSTNSSSSDGEPRRRDNFDCQNAQHPNRFHIYGCCFFSFGSRLLLGHFKTALDRLCDHCCGGSFFWR